MTDPTGSKPSLKRLGEIRRKSVTVSQTDLVRVGDHEAGPLPLLVEPAIDGVDLTAWIGPSRERVEGWLHDRGGVLFRGFSMPDEARFQAFVEASAGKLLEYKYRSTPRTQLSGRIYTSTEYPADQSIPMHNEMSYSAKWPMKIAFCCVQPAAEGGETPIADSRLVYQRIDPELREEFARRGVMYVRNYGEGLDLTWQDVFQTGDREQVEVFCRESGIELEWRGDDRLTTRQVCQGVAEHPVTGAMVWFNQAHLFHVSSLDPSAREVLVSAFGEGGVPRTAFFGDGTTIPDAALDHVREVYAEVSVAFPWQRGDVLLLDNMLVAHGRRPYGGARRIVVGMAEPHGADAKVA